MKRVVIISLALVLLTACGEKKAPAPPPRDNTPQWADVFDGSPEIYGVIRVQALKRDSLYGTFWKSLLRVAQARGFARGATMVEAAEGSEEIIVGISRNDAAVVLRNVPASLDPATINDANGHPLFHPVGDPRAKVPEYELLDRRNAEAGSVFVLPDRTWVGTLGPSRNRARQVFVTPLHRSPPKVEADGLIAVRFSGGFLHVFDRHPIYGPVTKKASSITFTLRGGKGGLVIALEYEDPDATAWSEMHSKKILDELAKGNEQRFGWLKSASVKYEGNTVFVRVAIPQRLIEELPNASGSDFGL